MHQYLVTFNVYQTFNPNIEFYFHNVFINELIMHKNIEVSLKEIQKQQNC